MTSTTMTAARQPKKHLTKQTSKKKAAHTHSKMPCRLGVLPREYHAKSIKVPHDLYSRENTFFFCCWYCLMRISIAKPNKKKRPTKIFYWNRTFLNSKWMCVLCQKKWNFWFFLLLLISTKRVNECLPMSHDLCYYIHIWSVDRIWHPIVLSPG